MMGKVAFKLLLVLTWNLAAGARNCRQAIPTSCMINTNIELTVQTDHYDLQLCSNGQCLPAAGQERWIRCDRMCSACESMANRSFCGSNNNNKCEIGVSSLLDIYCSSNTPSTSTLTQITTTRITTTQTRVTTVRSTVTTTTRIPTTVRIPTTRRVTTTNTDVVTTTLPRQTVTSISTTTVIRELMTIKTVNVTASPTCDITTQAEKSSVSVKPTVEDNRHNTKLGGSANEAPVAALGALLGLSMILLAIVTAGWVWTLCAMKKKKSERAISKANVTNGDRTMNRCFPNPTYEMNTTAQEPPQTETEATYDVVASPGQMQPGMMGNGQTYAKLNRPKRNGHKPPRGMPSQQVNDDYSQLGLVNEDAENNYSLAGWEREGGHGGGDYADPNMEAEMVGGATEYEVPMPLRKNK